MIWWIIDDKMIWRWQAVIFDGRAFLIGRNFRRSLMNACSGGPAFIKLTLARGYVEHEVTLGGTDVEARHPLCSKTHIPCVRRHTFLVFEARHSLCSKQDIPCVWRKTFLVFETGNSLCSKQDIPCVPITKNPFATFWWIRPIVPGFVRILYQIRANPGTIGRIRPKVACRFFKLETA